MTNAHFSADEKRLIQSILDSDKKQTHPGLKGRVSFMVGDDVPQWGTNEYPLSLFESLARKGILQPSRAKQNNQYDYVIDQDRAQAALR